MFTVYLPLPLNWKVNNNPSIYLFHVTFWTTIKFTIGFEYKVRTCKTGRENWTLNSLKAPCLMCFSKCRRKRWDFNQSLFVLHGLETPYFNYEAMIRFSISLKWTSKSWFAWDVKMLISSPLKTGNTCEQLEKRSARCYFQLLHMTVLEMEVENFILLWKMSLKRPTETVTSETLPENGLGVQRVKLCIFFSLSKTVKTEQRELHLCMWQWVRNVIYFPWNWTKSVFLPYFPPFGIFIVDIFALVRVFLLSEKKNRLFLWISCIVIAGSRNKLHFT